MLPRDASRGDRFPEQHTEGCEIRADLLLYIIIKHIHRRMAKAVAWRVPIDKSQSANLLFGNAKGATVDHSPGDRRQSMNYSIFLIVGCVLILIGTVVTGPRKLREEMTGSGLICMGLGFLMIIYGLAAPG